MTKTILSGLGNFSISDFKSHPLIDRLVKIGARIEPITSFLLRPLTFYNAYVNPKCYRVAERLMGIFIENAPNEVKKIVNAAHESVATHAAASVLTQLRASEASIPGISSLLDGLALNKAVLGRLRLAAVNEAEQNERTVGAAPQDAIKNLIKPAFRSCSEKMGTIAIQTLLKMAVDYALLTSGCLLLKRMEKLVNWHQSAQGIARVIEPILMLTKIMNVAVVILPILHKVVGIRCVYLNQNTRAERIRNAIGAVVNEQGNLPNKPQLIALIEILLFTTSKINPPAASAIEELLDDPKRLRPLVLQIKSSPTLIQLIEKMPTNTPSHRSRVYQGSVTIPLGSWFPNG